eukprot:COSAG01_NODE_22740_length_843_cov_1.180108_2_plen_86_part_01
MIELLAGARSLLDSVAPEHHVGVLMTPCAGATLAHRAWIPAVTIFKPGPGRPSPGRRRSHFTLHAAAPIGWPADPLKWPAGRGEDV